MKIIITFVIIQFNLTLNTGNGGAQRADNLAKVAGNQDPGSWPMATLLSKVRLWRAHKAEYAATQRTGKGKTRQACEGTNGYQKLMTSLSVSCPEKFLNKSLHHSISST